MKENWGIYVHVPWCRRRCPYCDFYFEVGKPEPDFNSVLVSEFLGRRSSWPEKAASTLYFGGGTPSVLPVAQIESFIGMLRRAGDALDPNAEITIEANPEDIEGNLVAGFKSAGVNRVSLGIQSFDDGILKNLGRKHTSYEALKAVETCLEHGIERISVDLIFGVPTEDADTISASVKRVRELGVGHISAYLLTVEPGTALEKQIERGRQQRPDEDKQAQAYEDIQLLMAQNGYNQYEVSSYAIRGQESRHNRNYWGKGPYLGLGPSAHSLRICADGSVERCKNKPSISAWREAVATPVARDLEILCGAEAFLESVSFGLRDLLEGVQIEKLACKHRCDIPKDLNVLLERAIAKGWVSLDAMAGVYRLTPVGVRFSDGIAREILGLA